jgi:VanZ family protein
MASLRWKNFVIPSVYYAAILSLSALPASRIQKVNSIIPLPSDKIMHLTVYAGFGFVLAALPYPSLPIGIAGSALGALDEQSQRLSPGRDVSVRDWIADVLGISLGIILRRFRR